MNRFEFSLVRYCGDPVRGEALNIGVLVKDPGTGAARVVLDPTAPRRVAGAEIGHLSLSECEALEKDLRVALGIDGRETRAGTKAPPQDGQSLSSLAGLGTNSIQFSAPRSYKATSLDSAADELFCRMVSTVAVIEAVA